MKEFLDTSDRKLKRNFLPVDFVIGEWEALKPYFDQLMAHELDSKEALQSFLHKRSELDSAIAEDFAWRYINMTCHTQNEGYQKSYQSFLENIYAHLSSYDDKLNRKMAESPFFEQLPEDPYLTFVRSVKRNIELYRESNVKLSMEAQQISKKFGEISGAMTIEHEEKTLTLQQAGKFLEVQDRNVRETVWKKVQSRRDEDTEKLESVFDELVKLRHEMAINAGYDSYTSFKFDSMGRFDYGPEDTRAFHDAVEKVVKPVVEELAEERKSKLALDKIKPWDNGVDIYGDTPLVPFKEASELREGTITALGQLRPELGQMIRIMDEKSLLDLESRVGKAPGGYNYPLMETGIPFIFMNASGTQTDVVTMFHESGHAVHTFLSRDLPISAVKSTPAEVAELASHSMELLLLEGYKVFYDDEVAMKRAQKRQLRRCITLFPWIATVDAFQQWIYDNPNHSREERYDKWKKLYFRFHGNETDWEGQEHHLERLWLKQIHIFEYPFYYIEYAIAQLGALGVWKNFIESPQEGLDNYLEALKLGYTQPIPQIYQKAGLKFDFGAQYMKECIDFCMNAYREIKW
ncbi:MAG: M3 family oligoendopeptidase [Bacteroidia bacterium]|nr:M3 family oligoendopeptidase [Bacteroidia bacterium]